ncbi:pyridoxal phosphate-dependent decarboxylase family protein [Croceibacter atlanticus]|jgi:aromatic-L-amino-acid decarboxylase|uniref:Decarboxylase, pyridoxal-dependent n=1 Tax=Croceibacter atlanticus (strain ATCC BAA-628 / JCM 21780 / CIP 108009 / IAM 15332 / KCTC 12090 / HTCC2559) TaxID=216432 RepID=A3U766_CROAH|nr:aspartate aminotransferase family protein [Croceibacter atlanticus]EAP88083.1 decarboxylase, pyridoxal-dependent [Croceibacter atlanticus HTCC2559]MBW4969710.1 aspartate aminotransferase family protein [Croceibacter atlanticus]|tara:strand:+ start:123531 stop:124970 length:1440 start_codon:yes stop_codon:yes gene_type:complete
MTTNAHKLELTKEEMRTLGYKAIDELVEHFDTQNSKLPVAEGSREDMDKLFLEDAPEEPTDAMSVLNFVVDKVMSNSNIVSHPKSYSFVPGPSNYVSTIADTLATGFNVFSGGWVASPAAAELEIVTINWLLKLFGFPSKRGGGIFTSGGSMANLTAIVTARRIKCGEDFSKAVLYLSDQAHSSNIKAITILGFRRDQIRIIPTDLEFKMSLNKLQNAIAKDRLQGLQPFCIVASSGTTNTGTVDPLLELSKICKKEKLWFHIDGAYGGAAILAKNGKQLLKGIDKADSLTVDPHKWFYQPYEMGCLLVRNSKWLKHTFTEKPEYLKDVEGNDSEINFYDHGVQLTRRFRALKLYMSVKTFGLKAFRKAIDYNLKLAEQTEAILRKSSKWEVVSPATLAVINFRYNSIKLNLNEEELDELNQKISEKIMASREALLVTTILQNQIVLRMCLINPRTTLEDVKGTINLCEKFAEDILKNA